MIRTLFKSLFALFAVASLSSTALAVPGVGFGIMVGPNLNVPTVPSVPGVEFSGGIGYTVGPSASVGPVEASVLYSSYTVKTTGLVSQTDTSSNLEIPVLYRLDAGPVGIGLGGFYALSLESGATSDDNNYGAVGSVRVTIPGGFFADGRFNLGLREVGGSKASSAALLLGFNFI